MRDFFTYIPIWAAALGAITSVIVTAYTLLRVRKLNEGILTKQGPLPKSPEVEETPTSVTDLGDEEPDSK
jgi:hypothetical protein